MVRFFTLVLLCLCHISVKIGAQPLPKLIPYKTTAGWGYSDSNKVMRLPAVYTNAGLFYNGKALVTFGDGDSTVYCVIDEAGRYIIPPKYHWVGPRAERGLYGALNARDSTGRLGMIDTAGNVVLPFVYDQAPLVQSGYCRFQFRQPPGYPQPFMIVGKDGRQGVINKLGKVLIPFIYDSIQASKSMNAYWGDDTLRGWVVQQGGRYGALSTDGRHLFKPRYDAIYPIYKKPWAVVRIGRRFGAVDTSGAVIVPAKYDTLIFNGWSLTTGFQTMLGGKYGWYDAMTGKEVRPAYNLYDYGMLPYGAYGYVVVGTHTDSGGSKQMLLSGNGKLLVPPLYDQIMLYKDSIVVRKYMSLDNDKLWGTYEARLDKKTWRPGSWHRPSPDASPVASAAEPSVRHVRRVQEGEYYLPQNGVDLSTVSIEGKTWEVTGYLRADEPAKRDHASGIAKRYYIVTHHSTKGDRYAAVDTSLRFVLLPQDRYEIRGGNFFHNKLIVRNAGLYLVTDTAFNPLSPAISRPISNYIAWQGRHYFLGAWRPGQLTVPQKETYNCFRCNCITVLNHQGEIAPGFGPYCIGRFSLYGTERPPMVDDDGIVRAEDSLGRYGYINLRGEIQYPAVSFKYANLYKMSGKVFVGYERNRLKIVSDAGKDYFSALEMSYLSSATAWPVFGGQGFQPINCLREARYKVSHTADHFVYIDAYGTVYADEAALK